MQRGHRARGSRDLRDRVEQGAQLRVAIAAALNRLRVQTERDIVHEHAPVDLGQIDALLPAADEGVERADDIVAIDAEIEREVVACARRNARIRQAGLGCCRCHDRLRPVPAGHRKPVGPALERGVYERLERRVERQLDRLDAAPARLVGEVKALRLPATRARIEEHHRMRRRLLGGLVHADRDGDSGRGDRTHSGKDDRDRESRISAEQQDHSDHERDERDRERDRAGHTSSEETVPSNDQRQHREREHEQAPREVLDERDHGQHDGGHTENDREQRREAPAKR